MKSVLDGVIADLAIEGQRLDTVVAALDADGWRTPTPAAGWDIAAQISHLAWTDEVAVAAATDKSAWDEIVTEAIADPGGYIDAEALAGTLVEPGELLLRWRAARGDLVEALRAQPDGQKIPWFGPPMSATSMATARFMETWAHSLDVHEALGVEPEITDRIRHVAHLAVRTRNFSFVTNGLDAPAEEFRIDLVSPSEDVWSYGPEDAAQTVTGSAYDLCLLATQRIHRDDTDLVASGADAEAWLGIAQCFAGQPGEGRATR